MPSKFPPFHHSHTMPIHTSWIADSHTKNFNRTLFNKQCGQKMTQVIIMKNDGEKCTLYSNMQDKECSSYQQAVDIADDHADDFCGMSPEVVDEWDCI